MSSRLNISAERVFYINRLRKIAVIMLKLRSLQCTNFPRCFFNILCMKETTESLKIGNPQDLYPFTSEPPELPSLLDIFLDFMVKIDVSSPENFISTLK